MCHSIITVRKHFYWGEWCYRHWGWACQSAMVLSGRTVRLRSSRLHQRLANAPVCLFAQGYTRWTAPLWWGRDPRPQRCTGTGSISDLVLYISRTTQLLSIHSVLPRGQILLQQGRIILLLSLEGRNNKSCHRMSRWPVLMHQWRFKHCNSMESWFDFKSVFTLRHSESSQHVSYKHTTKAGQREADMLPYAVRVWKVFWFAHL